MIEAVGLTKRYGRTVAVDDLSFTARPGVVTGFLGPNGAGKSTAMRMVLGLDRPDTGFVLIDGKRFEELRRPLRVIGGLLDAKWVHPHRTARNHLRWLARAADLPRKRVDEVLDLVGLTKAARSPAGDFSLGMSQRLGIAAALLGDPQVLLFDEPVNGLDPQGIAWVRRLMRTMADNGRTVLVSSHLLAEMAQTADELIVIGRGRLIAQCPTAQFISEATESSVRVRTAQVERLQTALVHKGASVRHEPGALVVVGLDAAQIGEMAAAHGVVLHELSPKRGSLEDAYLHHTGDAVEYQAG